MNLVALGKDGFAVLHLDNNVGHLADHEEKLPRDVAGVVLKGFSLLHQHPWIPCVPSQTHLSQYLKKTCQHLIGPDRAEQQNKTLEITT